MGQFTIGIPLGGRDSNSVVNAAVRAEQNGLNAAWLTSGSGLDAIGLSIASAMRTERIQFGTGIIHTWSMAPVKMAQLGQLAAQVSGGRFRLGVGVAGANVEGIYGVKYSAPFGHLREYVAIIKSLVETGEVDLQGKYYQAKTRLANPQPMPVMIAALGQGAFRLAGEISDGAISWIVPPSFLKDVAAPAIQEGADAAGRPAPPLIAHAPVAASTDKEAVRAAARQQFGFYLNAPHYRAMWLAAGFPDAESRQWSDDMIDALVSYGTDEEIEAKLAGIVAGGAAELLVSPINGVEPEKTTALLGRLSKK